jgi:hypothetical protein
MAKVTSRAQTIFPKALAEREVDRLRIFDEATLRQQVRELQHPSSAQTGSPLDRGWTREELYGTKAVPCG